MVTNRYRETNRRYEKNHAACFYPLPLSSKDRGDLELVPYYNEHPLVNEAIRQVEQLQKQQEKKKHRDVAR